MLQMNRVERSKAGSFLCTENCIHKWNSKGECHVHVIENGSTYCSENITWYKDRVVYLARKSLLYPERNRKPLKSIFKGSERIRFVLQKSFIEKSENLIIAQTGKMGNEGREKFRTIPRFLTELVILPFPWLRCRPGVKWWI